MTEHNDRPEVAQEAAAQEEGSEREVEVTAAARRRAEEMGLRLATVYGTAANDKITARDVQEAYEQIQRTTMLAEVIQGTSSQLSGGLRELQERSAEDSMHLAEALQELQTTDTPPLTPRQQGIVDQYNVLKAILADPETRVRPSPPDFPYNDLERDFAPHTIAQWQLPDPRDSFARTGDGSSHHGTVGAEGAQASSVFAPREEDRSV